MKKKVTLKANLHRGVFYWVCSVDARSNEEAIAAAENLFLAEVEHITDWSFSDFDVETG